MKHASHRLAALLRRLIVRAYVIFFCQTRLVRGSPHWKVFVMVAGGSALLHATACAPSHYLVTKKPAMPFDAVIVPGCPSEADGSPSFCQLGRAGEAALLWQRGWTTHFIVSGSAVHSPYVEAEAIAQAMTVLGVPPERIVLERDALHTDENVYYSLRVAEQLGFDTLAVASNEPFGSWMCSLMSSWGHTCSSIDMDIAGLQTFMPPFESRLHALRAPRVARWEPLDQRELRIAKTTGHARPPSYLYYPLYGTIGRTPIAPEHAPITWEDRAAELVRSQ